MEEIKNNNKLKILLLNPHTISISIVLIIYFCFPKYFPKYSIENTNTEIKKNNGKLIYNDIDFNGKSESFSFVNTNEENFQYVLYDDKESLVQQFNLKTKLKVKNNFWFQDVNKNKFKEFYFITISNDSIFLNIHEHKKEKNIWQEKIFIDTSLKGNINEYYSSTANFNIFNINLDNDEIIFSLSFGFGLSPRNIYKYNYKINKLLKSNYLTNTIFISDIVDINNDGKKEILLNSSATSNDTESLKPYKSDNDSWIIVLKNDLSFLFEPIKIQSKGKLNSISLKDEKTNITHLVYLFESMDKKKPSKLIKLSASGAILKELNFLSDDHKIINKYSENTFTIYNYTDGKLNFYNSDFELIKVKQIKTNIQNIELFDLDSDGNKEWLISNSFEKDFFIYRNNLNSFVKFSSPLQFNKYLGIKKINNKNHLYSHNKKIIFYFKYGLNKYYYLNFVFYILLYVVLIFLFFLVTKGQKIKLNKLKNLEKKIQDLQLTNIKSQLDTHLVFNSINSISEMTLTNNTSELEKFIASYSKFIRATLENSTQLDTSIENEISFVENFLELQKIKLNHKFEYKFVIDDSVNKLLKIPKYTIFTYVENSIKHGLPEKKNGKLIISINKIKDSIVILVSDNGNGLPHNFSLKNSKGYGLKIQLKIFDLFMQRFNYKIQQSFKNNKVKEQIVGLNVVVTIKV